MNGFWPTNAIALGVWETAFVLGRAPSITSTVHRAALRNPAAIRIGVVVWLAALGFHLLSQKAVATKMVWPQHPTAG